jgi:hypothetical protein
MRAERALILTGVQVYLRGLNTTRMLVMADWEELDRLIAKLWLWIGAAPQRSLAECF